MKKYILLLLLASLPLFTIKPALAASTQKNALWKEWVKQFKKGVYSQKNAPRKTYRPPSRPSRSRNERKKHSPTTSFRKRNRRNNTYSYSKRTNVSQANNTSSYLWTNINPITRNSEIQIIDSTPIQLFEINFSQPRTNDSFSFPHVSHVNKLTFDIIDNAGLVSDPSKLQININKEKFNFKKNGTVTVKLNNARILSGKDLSLNVAINIEDANAIPHNPGFIQVRLKDVEAYNKSTYQKIQTITKGNRLSDIIKWNPIPQVTSNTSLEGQIHRIEGRTLHAGENECVLSTKFEAHHDDMRIQNIIVTDKLSGKAIDTWSYRLRAYDTTNGDILGDSRFLGGQAKFTFRPPLHIERNQAKTIGYRIYLNNRINPSTQIPEFKLDIQPNHVTVYGVGSGREIPIANRYFNTQTESFVIANTGIQVLPSPKQPNHLITNQTLNDVYRFKIKNTGRQDLSIARISTNVWLESMEYPEGISDDDFRLVLINKNQIISTNQFTSTVKSSSKIAFDAITEITIPEGTEQEFGIQVALTDQDGKQDQNSISIKLLNDSKLTKSTLKTLQAEARNFIWSDHTDRLHSINSSDFISGYKVSGLPTNTYIKNNR